MRATIFVLVLIATTSVIYAQSQTNIAGVESRVSAFGRTLDSSSGEGVLFLFGAFCALWAQNSGRNAWLWFFLGLFLSVIAVVALLVKNENDRKRLQASSPAG